MSPLPPSFRLRQPCHPQNSFCQKSCKCVGINFSLSLGKLCKNRSNAFQSSSNPSRLLYGLACLIESIVRATNRGGQFRARWAIYLVSFWLLKIECISKQQQSLSALARPGRCLIELLVRAMNRGGQFRAKAPYRAPFSCCLLNKMIDF